MSQTGHVGLVETSDVSADVPPANWQGNASPSPMGLLRGLATALSVGNPVC